RHRPSYPQVNFRPLPDVRSIQPKSESDQCVIGGGAPASDVAGLGAEDWGLGGAGALAAPCGPCAPGGCAPGGPWLAPGWTAFCAMTLGCPSAIASSKSMLSSIREIASLAR